MEPAPGLSAFEIEIFGSTDPGLQRENNEDNFLISDLTSGNASSLPGLQKYHLGGGGVLLLVSDGMGGEQAGEIASRMCVELMPERLRERLEARGPLDLPRWVEALDAAVQHANSAIHEKAQITAHERGMGCTLTAGVVIDRQLLVAQVGDSRAYLIRGGEIQQLTRDQTLGDYLASHHPDVPNEIVAYSHNILTQAIGSAPNVRARITGTQLCHGDCVLLCSDGLYNMVANDELLRIVTGTPGLANATRELIRRANARGGPDNITVVLARFHVPGKAESRDFPPIECIEIKSDA